MDDYLSKPLRLQTLAAVIDRFAQLRPAREHSLFDSSALTELGDLAAQAALVEMFIDQTAERLPALRGAVDGADAARLGRLAHGLKGSAASVGANRISALCDALCELANTGITSRAAELHLQLFDAFADTSAAMGAYLEQTAHLERKPPTTT
ncbi:MAG: Hpt domain-containing protein [Solirubrobacteraceae bacterium]